MYEYKGKIQHETTGFNLEAKQVEFVKSLENKSHYMRWLINNDPGYQGYIKKQEEEEE